MIIEHHMGQLTCESTHSPTTTGRHTTAEERGAIFTRREVVDFILDLSGYTVDQPLHQFRVLEPSVGDGDFLVPIVERLLSSYRGCSSGDFDFVQALSPAIYAVEIHPESAAGARARILDVLRSAGVAPNAAAQLLDRWIHVGDFLLADLPHSFTHALGNPPYVRQERIPSAQLTEYRRRFQTMYDRADLYVPFIERCLEYLKPGGVLGFICSDRWMKNRYGGPLRALVSSHFHLAYYVDMVDVPAFHAEVIAYPAITIIRREKQGHLFSSSTTSPVSGRCWRTQLPTGTLPFPA